MSNISGLITNKMAVLLWDKARALVVEFKLIFNNKLFIFNFSGKRKDISHLKFTYAELPRNQGKIKKMVKRFYCIDLWTSCEPQDV